MTAKAMGGKAFALLLAAVLTTAGGAQSGAQAANGDKGPDEGQAKIKKVPRGDKIG